jgi:uncharacterized cupin superfamily protein
VTAVAKAAKTGTHWRKVFALTVFGALMLAALAFANSGRAAIETPPPPSVWSDKADYAPGEQVNLSGANWAPGESVHIRVNDDAGETWRRDVDVTADDTGAISDQFNLPDWFVAQYNVTATGASSGTATWSFTDADATTTTLTSSANPSNLNDSVTFTATVTRSVANTIVTVGMIRFGTGGNCGGGFTQLQGPQAPNASGQATYSTSALPAGSTTLRACYDGTGGGSGTQDSTATLTQTVNAKQNQTITFTAPIGKTYGDPDFDPGATASSGLPVSYTSSTASVCTIVSGKVHIVAAGGCTVTASQAGNASFNAALDVTRTFTIAKANQTITFAAIADKTFGDADFDPGATASSGLAVSYSTGAGDNCSIVSGKVHITGAGSCTVTASQAGNPNYNAAPSVSRTFSIAKANQTITINTGAPATQVYDTSFTVAANASSGLPVSYSASGDCSNVGATFTMTSGTGTCTVHYNQAGNGNYNAAPEKTEAVTAEKANQTITITISAPASATYGDDFTVAATGGGSGNPVTFSASGGCANVGATFTMTSGSTDCTVHYNQAGDANYNAAAEKTETVTAQRKALTVEANDTSKTFGESDPTFDVSYSGFVPGDDDGDLGGSLVFNFAGVPPTSYGPSTSPPSNAGSYKIRPSGYTSANYSFVYQSGDYVIHKADQTITINTGAPATKVYDTSFTVAASASSGLPVSYSASGDCSNVGATFTMTSGTGTCTVHYNQAGNGNYNAAPEKTEAVTAEKANQTITFAALAAKTLGDPPFTVSASGGGSGNPVTFSASPSTTCTSGGTNGATITIAGVGTCTVTSDQAGNGNYKPAPSVSRTFAVNYNFTGFFAPVDNNDICNGVKAGSAIPIKFSLHGYQGMNIFAAGYPKVTAGTCAGVPLDTVEETVTAGGSSLNYDSTSDQYIYVWKTDKAWAGKAMRLTIVFADGTTRYARFSFTK